VKDWRLDTIRQADRQTWEIAPGGVPKSVANPVEQARQYAHQVVDALRRDRQLVQPDGTHRGELAFPWSYGVVFTHITRRQFDTAELGRAIPGNRVLCTDEMTDATDAEDFQSRLWGMFPYLVRGVLSLPQIDRVRWVLFPQVRVDVQPGLFEADQPAAADEVPDMVRVMDLQQEQLARSLGDGHRVIHGVAGSGKTMILGYRAEALARTHAGGKPILVLCYNEPLAVRLQAMLDAKGLDEQRVVVRHFHRWCRQQLVAYGQRLPADGDGFFDRLVDAVIRGVERRQIPSGQYHAVLIDEGHDFRPEWLKLVVQMVDPVTNSLLLLYDDAQSIYHRGGKLRFTLKSVGIEATGRTTVLKINYRNTRQVLALASKVAGGLLHAEERGEDESPLLQPMACGREGDEPLLIRLPSLRDEAAKVAELLADAHARGTAWGDMAVLCRHWHLMDLCADALRRRRLPHQVRKATGSYRPAADTIKVMTMHASKGLEFPLVVLPGVGQLPEPDEDEAEEARLFYVAATRATERLVLTMSADGAFARRLMGTAQA
jgi:superfamily I DNA/RNA helicase